MHGTEQTSPKNYDGFLRFSLTTDAILKNIQKYKNEQLSAFGLRSMHLMFLYCLSRAENGMTPGELAKSCSVDKAFISRITAELKTLGYVHDGEDAGSRHYKKLLSLTEAGQRVMQCVNTMIEEAVEKISAGISPEQLETFYAVLSHMDENLLALAQE
ncbi:MAG: hypothetical protein IJC71_01250 [Clostridia bacterium]|nr:hypothetical protein [Clostridia bacterium]